MNAAAITAVNRALAHYRGRQAHSPTNHSAREIAPISMLSEYLHETPEVVNTRDTPNIPVNPAFTPLLQVKIVRAAA